MIYFEIYNLHPGICSYKEELAQVGRLKRGTKIPVAKGRAQNMALAGKDKDIVWESNFVCQVPSETSETPISYQVDLLRLTCQCPVASQTGWYIIWPYIIYPLLNSGLLKLKT